MHNMQSRVADLIERVQDEVILESTLQINDELNSVFVRYDRLALPPLTPVLCGHISAAFLCRYLRNREAAMQQQTQAGETAAETQPATLTEGGVATTSLSEVSMCWITCHQLS